MKRLISLAMVLVFCLLVVALVLPALPIDFSFGQSLGYTGFIDFWHIESFEGGSANRSTWLKRRALEFEKQNTGLLIHITTLTYEQAQQKLLDGDKFDLISFSYGIGNDILPLVSPFGGSVYGIFDNLLTAGEIENITYAVPYMAGIYGLFARQNDLSRLKITDIYTQLENCSYTKKIGKNSVEMSAVGCGFSTFNSPLSAISKQFSFAPNFETTQYQAYQQFVNNRDFTVLVGTQRDIFRLKNRLNQGKIEPLTFSPLNTFSDLVQFAAISKFAEQNRNACVSFVEFLTSSACQKKLVDIGMFSTATKIYSDEWYVASENALAFVDCPNVFTSPEHLLNLRKSTN